MYIQYNTLYENTINSQIVSVFDLLYKNYSNKLDTLKLKLLHRSIFMSENIIDTALKGIFQESKSSHYDIVDFIIYNNQDKKCALTIEVDDFEYHENNPEQLKRDAIKNSIPDKDDIPLLRLATSGSGEREKVKNQI